PMEPTNRTVLPRPSPRTLLWILLLLAPSAAAAFDTAIAVAAATEAAVAGGSNPPDASPPPGADSRWPLFLGAQYTFVDQKQTPPASPYQGKLSLSPDGDRQSTHTIGIYTGWAPWSWGQLYFDVEKFMGAGVSGGTGLGGLTNGDVVRAGAQGL